MVSFEALKEAIQKPLLSIKSKLDKLTFDSNNNVKVALSSDEIGFATESTLSQINSKITKCDTDNVSVINFPTDYPDSTTHTKLQETNDKLSQIISDLSLIQNLINSRATENTLSQINDKIAQLTFDTIGLKVSLYSEKVSQHSLSSYSLGANESKDVTIEVPPGKTGVAVTLKSIYDAGAIKGVKIGGYYSPDGQNYDTDSDDVYDHPFSPGVTKQKTYIFPAVHPYMKVSIQNLDTSKSVTIDVWTTFI